MRRRINPEDFYGNDPGPPMWPLAILLLGLFAAMGLMALLMPDPTAVPTWNQER